jgi:hypothetical protein
MKGIRSRVRHEIVRRMLGRRRRLTPRQMKEALRRLRVRGWLTAMSADGPAYEQVAAVHKTHPLARLLQDYNAGSRWFSRADVEGRLGLSVATRAGAARLAMTGFAVVRCRDDKLELRAADPRAARFVNEARCGAQLRGFGVRRIVEAFLSVRNPERTRVNVTDDRRLMAAEVLSERWNIECEDLLDGRARVRLFSAWTFDHTVRAVVQPDGPTR